MVKYNIDFNRHDWDVAIMEIADKHGEDYDPVKLHFYGALFDSDDLFLISEMVKKIFNKVSNRCFFMLKNDELAPDDCYLPNRGEVYD